MANLHDHDHGRGLNANTQIIQLSVQKSSITEPIIAAGCCDPDAYVDLSSSCHASHVEPLAGCQAYSNGSVRCTNKGEYFGGI